MREAEARGAGQSEGYRHREHRQIHRLTLLEEKYGRLNERREQQGDA